MQSTGYLIDSFYILKILAIALPPVEVESNRIESNHIMVMNGFEYIVVITVVSIYLMHSVLFYVSCRRLYPSSSIREFLVMM